MTEELLPCPFCGGSDIRIDAHPHVGRYEHENETVYSMCCYACGATFPNRYKRQALQDAWNRRAAADEIDKLRREINMVLEEAAKVADGYGAGIVPRRIAQDIRSLKRECSRYQRIR